MRAWLRAVNAMVLVIALAAPFRVILWPSTTAPHRADAIVMFAGGRGERLAEALRLGRAGIAPVVVLSAGTLTDWTGREQCGKQRPFVVRCLRARPATTRSEARAFAKLALREGWKTILAVTSTVHVARARLWLERCSDVHIEATSAGGTRWRPSEDLHEWLGLAWAEAGERRC